MKTERVGDILRLTRLRLRIKQREVAAALHVSPSVISAIENGWREPTELEVNRFRRALGVEEQELR